MEDWTSENPDTTFTGSYQTHGGSMEEIQAALDVMSRDPRLQQMARAGKWTYLESVLASHGLSLPRHYKLQVDARGRLTPRKQGKLERWGPTVGALGAVFGGGFALEALAGAGGAGAAGAAASGAGVGETGAVTGLAGSGFGVPAATVPAVTGLAGSGFDAVLPSTAIGTGASSLPPGLSTTLGTGAAVDTGVNTAASVPGWRTALRYGAPVVGGAIDAVMANRNAEAERAAAQRRQDEQVAYGQSTQDPFRGLGYQTGHLAQLEHMATPPKTYTPPAGSPYARYMNPANANPAPSPEYLAWLRNAQALIARGEGTMPNMVDPANWGNPGTSNLTAPSLPGAPAPPANPAVPRRSGVSRRPFRPRFAGAAV